MIERFVITMNVFKHQRKDGGHYLLNNHFKLPRGPSSSVDGEDLSSPIPEIFIRFRSFNINYYTRNRFTFSTSPHCGHEIS